MCKTSVAMGVTSLGLVLGFSVVLTGCSLVRSVALLPVDIVSEATGNGKISTQLEMREQAKAERKVLDKELEIQKELFKANLQEAERVKLFVELRKFDYVKALFLAVHEADDLLSEKSKVAQQILNKEIAEIEEKYPITAPSTTNQVCSYNEVWQGNRVVDAFNSYCSNPVYERQRDIQLNHKTQAEAKYEKAIKPYKDMKETFIGLYQIFANFPYLEGQFGKKNYLNHWGGTLEYIVMSVNNLTDNDLAVIRGIHQALIKGEQLSEEQLENYTRLITRESYFLSGDKEEKFLRSQYSSSLLELERNHKRKVNAERLYMDVAKKFGFLK